MSPTSRDQLVASSIKAGLSPEVAAEMVDISKHAFDEAFATARRITDTANPSLRLPIMASVASTFATVLRDKFPEHWAGLLATPPNPEGGVIVLGSGS